MLENIRNNLRKGSSSASNLTAIDSSGNESGIASPCVCTAERLLWGDAADMRSFPVSYDVVLAADVVALPYEGACKALLDTMLHLLRPDGCLWLCSQQRHASE